MGLGIGRGGWACSGGGLLGGWWRAGYVGGGGGGGGGVLCFRNGKEWSRNEVTRCWSVLHDHLPLLWYFIRLCRRLQFSETLQANSILL